MKLAEKFGLPVFTFVDTPGAYPGIGAEERGQSEAIGRNIFEMAQLEVPIIATIIGEGGSGGALAISVGDQVLMLQYSIYSVISPEGCASILWKTAERAADAAEALGITAHRLKALGLVDKIVNEPVGGAHRDPKQMAAFLKRALNDALAPGQRPASRRSCCSAATSGCSPTAASATRRSADAATAPRRASPSPSAAAAIRPRCCMRPLRRGARRSASRCVALHVHHGLSAARRRWLAHCEALCAALGAARRCRSSFAATRLDGRPAPARASRPGRGGRATARCAQMALGARRRSGAAGPPPARPGRDLPAAGAARRRRRRRWRRCRAIVRRDGITWARPWLEHAARGDRGLRAAASPALHRRRQQRRRRASRATGCACEVWPALERGVPAMPRPRWPRAARWAQEAQRCLDEVAAARPGRDRRRERRSTSPPGARCRRARRSNALARLAARRDSARRRRRAWSSGCCARLPAAGRARWPIARRRAAQLSRPAARTSRAAPCRDAAPTHAERRCDLIVARRRARARRLGRRARRRARRRQAASPLALAARLRAARARGRRAVPGRRRPAAAQPEEAVPGARRRAAWQRDGPLRLPRRRAGVRAGPRHRRARAARAPGEPQLALRLAAPRRCRIVGSLASAGFGLLCASPPRSAAQRRAPLPHGTDRSQVRRHLDGLDRAHPQRRQARRQMGARRPPAWSSCRRR